MAGSVLSCDKKAIVRGIDLGHKNQNRYVLHNCVVCGQERWVMLKRGQPENVRCGACASRLRRGPRSPAWRGGRIKTVQGYIQIHLYPDDFFFSMTSHDGYVMEHRLVMAKQLGRNLHRWEIVHHKNGIKGDNRLKNLQLVSGEKHMQITLMENRVKHLEARVTTLEVDNTLLLKELKELGNKKWKEAYYPAVNRR